MASEIKVSYITPKKCKKRRGITFRGGVTLIPTGVGTPEIIIDPNLSDELQQVYLAHEQAQLKKLEELPLSSIGHFAHNLGLQVGIKKAKELGVLEEYLEHRNHS